MAERTVIYTENVDNGSKANYPYESAYVEPTRENCVFYGWKYNNVIYTPQQYATQQQNPFGPITEDTEISAIWCRIFVYCVGPNDAVTYQGGNVVVTYYAVVGGENIYSNQVTLNVVANETTVSYTRGSDVVDNNVRKCTFNLSQNSSNIGKNLVVYAEYNGIQSEKLVIYQPTPYEVVIPDSDYFIFNYSWGESDGRDLDSVTIIYVEDSVGNKISKSFTNKPVGYRRDIPLEQGSLYQSPEVYSQSNLLCLKHGGDNILSGAEGAVICLTNIANSGEVSNLEKVCVEIYANWYNQRIDGNMAINCKGYKTLPGHTPNYNDDIIKNNFAFNVNTQNCEEVWSGFSQTFNVKANGGLNARYDYNYLENIGSLYSHIGTVVFDVGSGTKIWKARTVDNGRDKNISRCSLKYGSYKIGQTSNNDNRDYFDLDNNGQHFELIDIYYDFYTKDGTDNDWDTEYFMFNNNNDYICIEYWLDNNSNLYKNISDGSIIKATDYNLLTPEQQTNYVKRNRFIITKSDLGTTFNSQQTSWMNNMIVTQNQSTKKITLKFDQIPANNDRRELVINFIKFSEDAYHVFSLDNKHIWQNR